MNKETNVECPYCHTDNRYCIYGIGMDGLIDRKTCEYCGKEFRVITEIVADVTTYKLEEEI